jgi:hypothetical protein
MSFRPEAAHLPPQWRNLLLPLPLPALVNVTQKQKLSFRPKAATFTASIPRTSQLQNPKFPNIHTP